ncbi:hypothetical protein PV08_07631 [Exophiala spinifera]|uniref:Major facilitator superfamily (MFS) profile domain-containing protein n=1 Tax=Exophiala spinifera TaxID=91928 RepID=A0A0D1YIT0_9EURO|nr:uncharacterized protein PV08_07631 [Exophiala spinifera]KIW14846.1 hypothetical protein PV08_07631 [Exophiala spinifera]
MSISEASAGNSTEPENHRQDVQETSRKPDESSADEDEYPPKSRVLVTIFAMMLTSFCGALDRTILATAVPVITNHFNSLGDVGWYASAYLLTMAPLMLIMGRIYTFYNPKWVYMSSIGIFELGSLVCGVAPNSTALIIGRAIAGMGSAGIMSGAIVIVVYLVPLQKRPAYTGMFGSVFALASVAGPLLGGVFTDKVSWRWCFYINLPLGGVTLAILALTLKVRNNSTKAPLKEQIHQLDPLGTLFILPAIICLVLALQWGGTTYSWSNARIIVLLILFGILSCIFIYIQHWRKELATIPPRLMRHRAVVAGACYSFFSGAQMMSLVYFLPIWFQAIKGASAVHSGIMNIPAVLAIAVASMISGFSTRKFGYFTQFMYVSCIMATVGAGLISTFTTSTTHPKWIGYQVLWGLGLGFGMQQPSVAAQTVLSRKDVSTGVSIMFFMQTLGGAIFVSVSNNVFDNKLSTGLKGVPGINADLVTHTGATDLRHVVAPEYLDSVLVIYNQALRSAFYVCTALTAMTIVGCVFMPWISLKKAAEKEKAEAKAAKEAKKIVDADADGNPGEHSHRVESEKNTAEV